MTTSNQNLLNLLFKPTVLSIAMALSLTGCGNDDKGPSKSPTALVDTDKDGIADAKDNCPALANKDQKDTDSDGMGDVCDDDKDGDGVSNAQDAFPLDDSESADTDNDGTGNNADDDDDNDGITDVDEIAGGSDPLDSGSSPVSPNPPIQDADGDTIIDSQDNCVNIANKDQQDTDSDGMGDSCDDDKDGDGVNNAQDAFPLDKNESVDTDNDGTGNNADDDDDNDGVKDISDKFPLDDSESVDTDNDGTGNNADDDDDNDGVTDSDDAFPLDDSESVDTDGDLIGDNSDDDDDNDGVSDADEIAAGTDPLDDTSKPSTSMPEVLAKFNFYLGSIAANLGSKKDDVTTSASENYVQVYDRFGNSRYAARMLNRLQVIKANNFLFDNTTTDVEFSVSLWATMKTMDQYQALFSFSDGTNNGLTIRQNIDRYCNCIIAYGSGITTTSTTKTIDTSWSQIIVTYNNGTLKIYADGSKVGESTGNTIDTSFSEISIGGYYRGGHVIQGNIDDVTFYDGELTEQQVTQLYDSERPRVIFSE